MQHKPAIGARPLTSQPMNIAGAGGSTLPGSPMSMPNGQGYYPRMQSPYSYPEQIYNQPTDRSKPYPMSYNQHHVPQPSSEQQPLPIQPTASVPSEQSSNAFMVDNLLQSATSQKPTSYDTVNSSEQAIDSIADDDDEMSSYMAMASSMTSH